MILIPHLLSILGDGDVGRRGCGTEPSCRRKTFAKYGPGNYIPDVFIQYWSMRVMAYLGSLIALLAPVGRVADPQGVGSTARSGSCVPGLGAVVTPFIMNTAGWLLTENGRQPWIVQGLMKTIHANSPSVTSTDIWISLISFVLVYLALGAADLVRCCAMRAKASTPTMVAPQMSRGAISVTR